MIHTDVIEMKPGNRMVRLGFGQNVGNWFVRLDLWKYGFRITYQK